jgi:hypothetical protein
MINPKKTVMLMKQAISSKPATLASYITPICKLYTLHPGFLKQHSYEYSLWSSYLRQYNAQRLTEYKHNNLTANQQANMVTYDAIQSKFCELSSDDKTKTNLKQNLHHLLLAVMMNITPKRADLGDTYITTTGKIPKAFANKNFIILKDDDARLVLNEYKTYKIYGSLVEKLPHELVTVIKESLEAFPRNYLFVGQIGENRMQPYTRGESYAVFVQRAFMTHFGKSMGVQLWRKVYNGEQVDFNNESYEELERKAMLSGHSIGTQILIYKPRGQNQMTIKKKEELENPLVCVNQME